MKKYISVLAALSVVPAFALAQSLESDVDYELDQIYAEQAASASSSDNNVRATTVNNRQPIVILNQAPATATNTAVQQQPTAVINDTPLTEGRTERLRRARQDAEIKTEQKIVEKLETSRMEDEKKRAAILFGDKFNSLENQQQQQQPVQQVPVYVQPVAQAPVIQTQIIEEPKENTRDIIREELSMALKTEKEVPLAPIESKYVAGILGVGDVPDATNVQGNYAMGIALGSKFDNFIIEGSFLFSNYTVSGQGYPAYGGGYYGGYNNGSWVNDSIDVKQYSGSLAAKVQLFEGMIRPVFGGVVSYSYRGYAWENKSWGARNDATANSHAIDVGTIVGADLQFSPKYTIGLDFRYMWNLSSRVNTSSNWYATNTDMEKLQYYVMSLSGRVNF